MMLDQQIGQLVPSMGFDSSTAQRVLQAIAMLSPSEQQRLRSSIGTATGAAAGAIVTRFLGGKGLLAMSMGTALGAAAGYLWSQRQDHTGLIDFSGNRYVR
jgi:hypothetical protein